MHISNKCSVAIHCLIFISEFGKENKVTSELLSLSTGCNPVTIRNLLSGMKKEGIVAVKQGTGGATLAMEPREITVYRICMAVEPEAIDRMISIHATPSALCPVGRNIGAVLEDTYHTLKEDLIASMQSVTLEQILADYHEKRQQEEASGKA